MISIGDMEGSVSGRRVWLDRGRVRLGPVGAVLPGTLLFALQVLETEPFEAGEELQAPGERGHRAVVAAPYRAGEALVGVGGEPQEEFHGEQGPAGDVGGP
jgi:hypothetical protein